MAKTLIIGEKARTKACKALRKIAAAVGTTLGPAGLPAILDKPSVVSGELYPTVTKDGVTVISNLDFVDPVTYAVHQFAKLAANHSVADSGDGPQPLYSKVLTPTGFVDMRDVYVGMDICGTNGSVQKVLGVFPKGEKEIYEIEFSNNMVVECCADHLWTVVNTVNGPKLQTKTTKELQDGYLYIRPNGGPNHNYYVPRTVVEFADSQNMPLDPYLVGVLLGDGSLSGTGSVEMSLGAAKEHIISKLKLPEGLSLTTTYIQEKNAFRVKIKGKTPCGQTIHDIVESIGLLGTSSHTKFIPKAYLYSPIHVRTQLLQGLIDTDGHVNQRDAIEFSSVSQSLAYDFVELCRSLGKSVSTYVHTRKEGNGSYSMNPIYRVRVSSGRKYGNAITRITATGKTTQMQCIKVSNSDNLYITDNYITTHNTTSTVVLASAVADMVLNHKSCMPQAYGREVQYWANKCIEWVRDNADRDPSLVRNVALTSSNGDHEIADVALEALSQISAYGTVMVEKNVHSQAAYSVNRQEGYEVGRGYRWHTQMAMSCNRKAASENAPFNLKNVYVFIYNGMIQSMDQLLPSIKILAQKTNNNFSLLALSNDISECVGDKIIELNAKSRNVHVLACKLRYNAESTGRLQVMLDAAAMSGAQLVDGGKYAEGPENTLEEIFERLGCVPEIYVTPSKTILLGRSPKNWIKQRVEENKNGMEHALCDADRDSIAARNAELTDGLVTITVGAGHAASIQERADRVEDAVKAAQAAMRSGVMAGCGASYIAAAQAVGAPAEIIDAFRCIHRSVMRNYGADNVDRDFVLGETQAITSEGIVDGHFTNNGVTDAAETICSVIRNGVELGLLCSTTGCAALTADLKTAQELNMVKSVMGGVS